MSRRNAHAEDFCGLCCASSEVCLVVADALEADADRVHAASLELVEQALDALESCRRHDCTFHSDARDARQLLQTIVDTEVESEEVRHAAE